MRILIITAVLLIATTAFAEEVEIRVNRIEMGVAAPDEADGADGTKAQDYNSSRSNRRGSMDTDDDGDGLKARTENGGEHEVSWGTNGAAAPVEHSGTRPVRSARGKALDHNASRSNTTDTRRIDTGGIKDGVEDKNKNGRCRANGVDDDCDSADAAAANHNTTRSNQ